MSWSRQGYENASYCISQTGRSPARQRPTAAPSMPASASGVSTQRSGPKRSRRPAVARKTPPARPTSSPITSTDSSRASSVWRASFTASTSVSSATVCILRDHRGDLARRIRVRVLEHEPRIRRRLGLRLGDPGPHRLLRLAAHARDECVVEHAPLAQLRLEPPHALTAALLLDAILVDVRARVVGGRV